MDTQKVVAGLTLEAGCHLPGVLERPTLTLKPAGPLEYATTYNVRIGDPAVDTDGTKLPPYSTSFKTVGIGLRVTTLIPAPNTAGVSVDSTDRGCIRRPNRPDLDRRGNHCHAARHWLDRRDLTSR